MAPYELRAGEGGGEARLPQHVLCFLAELREVRRAVAALRGRGEPGRTFANCIRARSMLTRTCVWPFFMCMRMEKAMLTAPVSYLNPSKHARGLLHGHAREEGHAHSPYGHDGHDGTTAK